ncbi:hypothetical protein KEM48_013881, partial [Puccinia striiformis f. sp. tritici PST-130]
MLDIKDVFTLGKGVLSRRPNSLFEEDFTKLDALTVSTVVNHENNDDVLRYGLDHPR